MGLKQREKKIYANIISDGTIRVKTNEGDPLAVRRDYKLPDGTEGTKYEKVYDELSGKITGVDFYENEYGKTLNIAVSDENDDIILSMNITTNYAEDMMKKIPALDLSQMVMLKPYSFEDTNKKLRRGISVIQNGVKIKSFFHDAVNNPINGFPGLTKDRKEYDNDDWKIYFMQTRKFLQQYIEENVISTLVKEDKMPDKFNDEAETDEIKVDSPPFDDAPDEVTPPEEPAVVETKEEDKVDIPLASPEEKRGYIAELVKYKLGVETDNQVQIMKTVMQHTKVGYVAANFDKIIAILEQLPDQPAK